MQTPESLSSFNECPRPSSLAQPSLTAYECVVESRNASPNLMAGTILASSPHYFSAVEDYMTIFNVKLAGSGYLAEQTKSPPITLPV